MKPEERNRMTIMPSFMFDGLYSAYWVNALLEPYAMSPIGYGKTMQAAMADLIEKGGQPYELGGD